jgi:hypothetical protein
MKPFFHTRAKRRTTLVVLLAWVFALASGVANACLPQLRMGHGYGHSHDPTAAHTLAAGDAHERVVGHARAAPNDDGHMAAAKASCLKVCDDGSRSLVKQPSGFGLTDPGLAPFVALAWSTATAPVGVAPGRAGDLLPPTSGPPLRALFSRLAL